MRGGLEVLRTYTYTGERAVCRRSGRFEYPTEGRRAELLSVPFDASRFLRRMLSGTWANEDIDTC